MHIRAKTKPWDWKNCLQRDRIEAQIWGISAALKVPKSKVALILKWKKFGTTRTLSRASCLAKLSNQGRRALVREVAKNPMVTLAELQRSCVWETTRMTTITATDLHFHGKVARQKPLLREHLKDSQTVKNKIICSDETKNKLPNANSEAWWWQHHALGVFFSGRDWGTTGLRESWMEQMERYPQWKPGPERSWPQTGLKVPLPSANTMQEWFRDCECPWVAQPESWL